LVFGFVFLFVFSGKCQSSESNPSPAIQPVRSEEPLEQTQTCISDTKGEGMLKLVGL